MSNNRTLLIEDPPKKVTYSRGGGTVALLSKCEGKGQCYPSQYFVSFHLLDTVKKNIKDGSKVAPLKAQCPKCKKIRRLNSYGRCLVIAMVDAKKHRQVSDLRFLAEDLTTTSIRKDPRWEGDERLPPSKCNNYDCYKGHTDACISKQYAKLQSRKDDGKCMPITRWDKELKLKGGY
jgi:hypothetical protein